jgi:Ca-activated chloride channel family protein
LPTEGVVESDQILNNFAANAPGNLRLFAFGVGYDVDTFLLDLLAQEHHGTSTYVLPGEPLDEILSAFYAKISTPVLTDLELDFGELSVYDLYPNPLPDLFAGSQIVVVGRYREGGVTDVALSGIVNGQIQTFTFPDQVFTDESSSDSLQFTIPRLWATRKIGYLLNQVRLQGPEQELIDQIVRLSIRYGIVTPYTSYLVTEPMPLGAAEQERIAEETFSDLKSAPAAPSHGQDAVEQAAGEGKLRNADTVFAPPAESANRVRIVGPRTYVFSDGVWVDTAFDPDVMQTVKVAFLSDDYFALAAADPQLGAAFSLGSQVVVFSEGVVYEVVVTDSSLPAVEIPELENPAQPGDPEPTSLPENDPEETVNTQESESQTPVKGSRLPCISGMLPLALIPFLAIGFIRKLQKII